MNDYSYDFLKLEEERILLKKLNLKLNNLDSEINKSTKYLEKLKEILSKEKKDVDSLESFTLTYLFYKLKGNIEEKLTKEKYEFLELQARLIENEDYLNKLISNKKQILNDIYNIGDINLKYDTLLNSSAEYILTLNNEKSTKINSILERIKTISLEIKELKEALNEGDKLIPYIDGAISHLNSAKNWGIYDMMGGDFIATIAKRSKMDEASKSFNSIKIMLNRYNTELKDLSDKINASLNLDSMSGLMDYVFDNFFTDYFIQGKINSALDSTINLKSKINLIQSNLTNKLKDYTQEIEKLKNDLEIEIKK